MTIAQLSMANETSWQPEADVRRKLLELAEIMHQCIQRGCARIEAVLPGGLDVPRRAPKLLAKVAAIQKSGQGNIRLWPMLYAIAVGEENASGSRIVAAPTNGAAGVIPSVLECWRETCDDDDIVDFLLTAAAIGMIHKTNAPIAGTETGCQGGIDVACSMAAGGVCALMGGSPEQIEDAAKIAMERQLGFTCDPVTGLSQVPCIERNGIAAEEAIKSAQLAYLEDGRNKIPLDRIVATMCAAGKDRMGKYKETSLGGLALMAGKTEC